MNLDQLRYFSKLAQTQHYHKAATELFISQSALSSSIKTLEEELGGVKLFERVGRNVSITRPGMFFAKEVDKSLDILDRAVAELEAYQENRSGVVRVAAVETVQREYLPSLLSEFQEEIGHTVRFEVFRCTTYQAIQALKDGQVDIAFCGKLPDDSKVRYIPLTMQSAVVALNAENPLAHGRVSLEELKGYPLISYRHQSYMHQIFKDILRNYDLTFNPAFDDEITAATIVSTDRESVALILDTLRDISFPHVVFLPIQELPDPFHVIACAYMDKAHNDQVIDELIEFCESKKLDPSTELFEKNLFLRKLEN